jgi:hypothetical protein
VFAGVNVSLALIESEKFYSVKSGHIGCCFTIQCSSRLPSLATCRKLYEISTKRYLDGGLQIAVPRNVIRNLVVVTLATKSVSEIQCKKCSIVHGRLHGRVE